MGFHEKSMESDEMLCISKRGKAFEIVEIFRKENCVPVSNLSWISKGKLCKRTLSISITEIWQSKIF